MKVIPTPPINLNSPPPAVERHPHQPRRFRCPICLAIVTAEGPTPSLNATVTCKPDGGHLIVDFAC
jgi:hypothetical protein